MNNRRLEDEGRSAGREVTTSSVRRENVSRHARIVLVGEGETGDGKAAAGSVMMSPLKWTHAQAELFNSTRTHASMHLTQIKTYITTPC